MHSFFLPRLNDKCSRSQFCKKLSITAVSLSFFLLRPPFFFPPPSLFFYRRWDSCRRPFFSLGRKRGRPPFFLRLEYLPPQRRNCSGCADSRSLIFSQPADAVRRRRMWWSIRSSSRFDGAVSYYARTHMMASCAGPPNVDSAIPTSTTSRTSIAAAVARLKKMSSSTPRSHARTPS